MDEEINDIEDIGKDTTIINPDMWVYLAVTKAIESLNSGEELKTNFLKFTALINVAESIARGQGRLIEDYDSKIDEYRITEDYKKIESSNAKTLAITTKKIELLSSSIGSSGVIATPMKLAKN